MASEEYLARQKAKQREATRQWKQRNKHRQNAYSNKHYHEKLKVEVDGRSINKRAEAKKQARLRNKEYVYQFLLTHKCVDCGESDPIVLEFDHLSDKDLEIAAAIFDAWSIKRLQQEIDKCDVRCANCHRKKTLERNGGVRSSHKNRIFVDKYLSDHPCSDCGENDIIVLEFDHVRGVKSFNISTGIKRKSISALIEEIGKCDVRCANCHRKKTHVNKDNMKWLDK